MSDSHKLQRAAVKVTLDKVMKYIDKNPQENICKMLSVAEKPFAKKNSLRREPKWVL